MVENFKIRSTEPRVRIEIIVQELFYTKNILNLILSTGGQSINHIEDLKTLMRREGESRLSPLSGTGTAL